MVDGFEVAIKTFTRLKLKRTREEAGWRKPEPGVISMWQRGRWEAGCFGEITLTGMTSPPAFIPPPPVSLSHATTHKASFSLAWENEVAGPRRTGTDCCLLPRFVIVFGSLRNISGTRTATRVPQTKSWVGTRGCGATWLLLYTAS